MSKTTALAKTADLAPNEPPDDRARDLRATVLRILREEYDGVIGTGMWIRAATAATDRIMHAVAAERPLQPVAYEPVADGGGLEGASTCGALIRKTPT